MVQRSYVYALLSAFLIINNLANSALAEGDQDPPSTTRNIFKKATQSKVSDIKGNSTPWVKSEFVSKIQEFKDDVFEELKSSSQIQKIYSMTSDSQTTRDIYFKLANKFLNDLKHPVPAALANVVSKSGSLFEPLTMPIFFEAISINLAEFLLSHNVDMDRSTAKKYVDSVSSALDEADMNDVVSIWKATLDGYANFVKSYKFKLIDVIVELFELFASELIVLHDKSI